MSDDVDIQSISESLRKLFSGEIYQEEPHPLITAGDPRNPQMEYQTVWELSTLSLMVHATEARNAAMEQEIRPRYFTGASKVDMDAATRLVVGGFSDFFGSVELTVDAGDILNNRFLYWVDTDTSFKGGLVRIIVTDEEMPSKARQLLLPREQGHPLKQTSESLLHDGKGKALRSATESWLFDRTINYEFVIAFPIPFSLCRSIQFHSHNVPYCLRFGDQCRENSDNSVCEMVALAISRPDLIALRLLFRSSYFTPSELITPLAITLRQIERNSKFSSKDVLPESALSEAFLQMGMGNWSGASAILSLGQREQIINYLLEKLEDVMAYPTKGFRLFF